MKQYLTLSICFAINLLGKISPNMAQSCNCSVTVTKSGTYTPSNLNVPVGGTICIQAGTYTNLTFNGFQGTESKPITIQNCAGLVVVQNTSSGSAIQIGNRSRYVKMSGKGDANYAQGIKVAGTGSNGRGIAIVDRSTNIEIDNIEIQQVKGVGIVARSELTCDSTTWRDYYSMNGIKIHHNYIHDIEGDGISVGEQTFDIGKNITCNNRTITKFTPLLYNLEINHNHIENTGGKGINYAAAPDAQVHHNFVTNCGKLPNSTSLNNAVALGGGAGGDFYNNVIVNAQGSAISMIGFLGNQKIYNNLIVRPNGGGIFADARPGAIPNAYLLFAHNTIISPSSDAIKLYSTQHQHTIANNLVLNVGNGKYITTLSPDVKVSLKHNYFNGIIDASFFVDTTTFRYSPKSFTPLVNTGENLLSWGIKTDLSDNPRPNGSEFDIGCFESSASVATPNPNVCDYTIRQGGNYSPNNLTATAGNTVCIVAGTYSYFDFNDFEGNADQPIIFKNVGGSVNIGNSAALLGGITFSNCKYFKLTGTGDSTLSYGIQINYTGSGAMGVKIDSKSTDCEIDHVEIMKTGFAGIMAKTDPSCDSTAWRGYFVMRNVKIHDNFIHDVGGEGIYVGNSFAASGVKLTCNGVARTVFPHAIEGLEIYNNQIERSGCEGIQYGCSIDAKVHHNTLIDPGIAPFDAFQANGIQMGEGSGGDCYNNTIVNARGTGIIILGFLGNQTVYNNLIINAGYNGIFADSRASSIPNTYLRLVNNSIITTQSDAIKLYSLIHTHEVVNNLIVAPATGKFIVKLGTPVIVNERNNYKNTVAEAALLKDIKYGFYYPTARSPLVNAGENVMNWGITTDRDDNARMAGGSFDIGCFEFIMPGN